MKSWTPWTRLGEDLALLSVSPDDGRVTTAQRIGFGLMGSELVRLAAARRLTVTAGRIAVPDGSPCPDPLLDAALASLASSGRGVRATAWVSRPRRGIGGAYLERLTAAGVLQARRSTRLGIFTVTRWRITDAGRLAEARARLTQPRSPPGQSAPRRRRWAAWPTRPGSARCSTRGGRTGRSGLTWSGSPRAAR